MSVVLCQRQDANKSLQVMNGTLRQRETVSLKAKEVTRKSEQQQEDTPDNYQHQRERMPLWRLVPGPMPWLLGPSAAPLPTGVPGANRSGSPKGDEAIQHPGSKFRRVPHVDRGVRFEPYVRISRVIPPLLSADDRHIPRAATHSTSLVALCVFVLCSPLSYHCRAIHQHSVVLLSELTGGLRGRLDSFQGS